jgi:hypothetical protein
MYTRAFSMFERLDFTAVFSVFARTCSCNDSTTWRPRVTGARRCDRCFMKNESWLHRIDELPQYQAPLVISRCSSSLYVAGPWRFSTLQIRPQARRHLCNAEVRFDEFVSCCATIYYTRLCVQDIYGLTCINPVISLIMTAVKRLMPL